MLQTFHGLVFFLFAGKHQKVVGYSGNANRCPVFCVANTCPVFCVANTCPVFCVTNTCPVFCVAKVVFCTVLGE